MESVVLLGRRERAVICFDFMSMMLNGLFLESLKAHFLGKYVVLLSKVIDLPFYNLQHFL